MEDFTPLKVLTGDTHISHSLGATALTLSIPLHAGSVMMQALTQNIRYTLDGTTPTASLGFQLKAGDAPILFKLTSKMTLKFFREVSGAVLEYGYGE